MTKRNIVTVSIVLFGLAGCTATSMELHSATTSVGLSMIDIEKAEILENISSFIEWCSADSCDVLPSQFVLGNGQTQISNQIQAPNITANLKGISVKSLAFQDQNQWTQTWSLVPVTDYADLQRLQLLYKYAVQLKADTDKAAYTAFADHYIKLPIAGAPSGYAPLTATGVATGDKPYNYMPLPVPAIDDLTTVSRTHTWQGPPPSTWPTRLPDKKWIRWDDDCTPLTPTYMGRYGKHILCVKEADLQAFMLWILGATINTANSAKGGGGKAPGLLLNAQ